jgi:hypothetical protein
VEVATGAWGGEGDASGGGDGESRQRRGHVAGWALEFNSPDHRRMRGLGLVKHGQHMVSWTVGHGGRTRSPAPAERSSCCHVRLSHAAVASWLAHVHSQLYWSESPGLGPYKGKPIDECHGPNCPKASSPSSHPPSVIAGDRAIPVGRLPRLRERGGWSAAAGRSVSGMAAPWEAQLGAQRLYESVRTPLITIN